MTSIQQGLVATGASASSAGGDALRRNFQDLRSRLPELRANAARSIRQYLELEAQERSGEGFVLVLDALQKRIATEYGASLDAFEKLGFILLIDELVLLAAENSKMQLWMMSQLSSIIKDQVSRGSFTEVDILGAATRALGHFARSGSPRITYVLLDKEKEFALSRMKTDKSEMGRHAATMIITELSSNAPALFLNQDLKNFFDNVWPILCDPKIQVRVRAALAVRNMLVLESNRQSDVNAKDDPDKSSTSRRHDLPLYKNARSAFPPPNGDWTNNKKKAKPVSSQQGASDRATSDDERKKAASDPFHALHRDHLAFDYGIADQGKQDSESKRGLEHIYDFNNIPIIHAALLTFYELLDTNFQEHFLDMLNCIWRDEIRFHRDALVVHHVIALMPRMARFCESEMMPEFLSKVVSYLLKIIKDSRESAGRLVDGGVAFRALGQLSLESKVSKYFGVHMGAVLDAALKAMDNKDKRNTFSMEALECLEMVIRSQPVLTTDTVTIVKDSIFSLFNGSLSEPLIMALETFQKAIPSLNRPYSKRLLTEIALVLSDAGNSLTGVRLGTAVAEDGQMGGGAEVSRTPTGGKRRGWFFGSSSSGGVGSTTRDRLLLKSLEQRLGLFTQSADPHLVAMLQGVIDGSQPHPSATAVAEATTPLSLKNAFAIRRGGGKDEVTGHLSQHDLDAYKQRLALRTLGTFDFTGVAVLPFVMAAVVHFLESNNVGVRLEAVIACCRLLSSAADGNAGFTSRRNMNPAGSKPKKNGDPTDSLLADYRTAADYVVERLVVMALTDAEPEIRCRVVEELDSPKFRTMLLENPENLRSLFVLVNDQHFGVRAAAIVAIGHLAEKAPSYVVPALRTVLVRLLTELDFGGDVRHREESAALLGLLVKSLDPPLARPHVESMLKGLLPKLSDPHPGAAAAVMAAMGEVATVARDALLPHIGRLLSVAMDTLDERSTHGAMEREVALSTLSKVCKATIMSIWPYFFQRRLLDLILQEMVSSSSPWPVRRQAMIALGTLGALDPWLHKKNQKESQTLQALGDMFEGQFSPALSLESPDFAAQRYSLAGSVFDFAFGGGGYDSDEDDEFESEFIDELEDPATKDTMSGAMNHWKLASRKVATDPLDDTMDDLGADLDVVFKAPQTVSAFETGRVPLPSALRASGGMHVKKTGPIESIIAEDSDDVSAAPRATNLQKRARRDSLHKAAATIAPSTTTSGQSGQNAVATRALGGASHARRLSLQFAAPHMAQSSIDLGTPRETGLGEAGGPNAAGEFPMKDDKGNKVINNAERMQRLRALASGARVPTGSDDLGVFGLDPATILPSMVPENYDATVSVVALVRVLNDQAAASKRKEEAMSTIIKILAVLAARKREAIKPLLPHVVPAMLRIATTQLAAVNVPTDQRTWPLSKIGELVGIAQRDYRSYLPHTFELTRPYYGDQAVLTDILNLALAIAKNLEAKSLQLYIPSLLPELLGILRAERENPNLNWVNTPAVLGTVSTLGAALGDYLYLVLPMLMRLVDQTLASSGMVPLVIRVRAVDALNELVKMCDVADYASKLLHPLCKSLSECHLETTKSTSSSPRNRSSFSGQIHSERDYNARTLFVSLLSVLTNLVFRLEEEFAVFIPMVEEALQHTMGEATSLGGKSPLQLFAHDLDAVEQYRSLVQRVLRGHALPKPNWYNPETEDQTAMDSEGETDGPPVIAADKQKVQNGVGDQPQSMLQIDGARREAMIRKLKETIGDVAQRTTDDDWIEYMRRFSIALLKCSPSYALEACSSLAEIHEPLSQDLFNAAFGAIWGELSRSVGKPEDRVTTKQKLMAPLIHASNKTTVPPKDILQTLLNLAEFMEHDDKPLPLDMKGLGDLAFSTQAYAKSLRYKEIAFKVSPDKTQDEFVTDMAKQLIEVNKNLDQINAAHGIVEYLKRNQKKPEQQPSWYAQLGIWEKALDAYTARFDLLRATQSPGSGGLTSDDIDVNQGIMQCLKALGEWDRLAEMSVDKRKEFQGLKRAAKQRQMDEKARQPGADRNALLAAPIEEDYFLDGKAKAQGDENGPGGFGRAGESKTVAMAPSAALTTTLVVDRLQGYGDRFRPVSVLLKNSNRTVNPGNDRAFLMSPHGPSTVASPGTSDFSSTPHTRRVSYIDVSRAGGVPRRSLSGVGLSDMTPSKGNRSSMTGGGDQVVERHGLRVDEFESGNSKMAVYYEEVNKLGAYANWMLRRWKTMEQYVQATSENSYDGNFLRAILDIESDRFDRAEGRVEAAYTKLGREVTSNFGETYSRAYSRIVRVQELAELQELISFKRIVKRNRDGRQDEVRREFSCLKKLWRQRLQGVQQNVDVLLPILAVRSMVVDPREDIDTWLNFAKVARKQGRKLLSLKALMNLGIGAADLRRDDADEEPVHAYQDDDEDDNYSQATSTAGRRRSSGMGAAMMALTALHEDDANLERFPSPLFPPRHPIADGKVHPRVIFAYVNHLWTVGEQEDRTAKQRDAVARLKRLARGLNDLLGHNMGPGPMEIMTNLNVLPATSPRAGTQAPSPGIAGHPSIREAQLLGAGVGTSRRRSQQQGAVPRSRSKLAASADPHEDLVRSLKHSNVPEDQLMRLAIRCNCQLGEWLKALEFPSTVPDGSPTRNNSFARDVNSLASYTSKGVLQRPRMMMASFFGTLPTSSSPGEAKMSQTEWRKMGDVLHEALSYYETAIRLDNYSYRGWRLWALRNYDLIPVNRALEVDDPGRIVCAIGGLLRAIQLGSDEMKTTVLQDTLMLLQLWFNHDHIKVVHDALTKKLFGVPKSTWLEVIPQLIARVKQPTGLVCELLTTIGLEHPQQLLFPLTVASDRQGEESEAALRIMKAMEEQFPILVEQARLVSKELIRVAVLWPEMWHEGLEQASQLFFSSNRNVDQMMEILEQLHKRMEDPGPETLSEVGFAHAFGRDLKEAAEWLKAYSDSAKEDFSFLNQAWDLYYKVFKVISKQLDVKSLELRRVSPELLHATSLQLAVPGRYVDANGEPVRIERFSPTLRVIKSKQRPRVITMKGSDGADHMFLLKGHEDLRLDERVMQLLGLVNNLLAADGETHRADVEIQKYAVVPLSSRAGVMQWVPHCDTLHELIREYRDARKIPVNVEHRVINEFAPQFDTLSSIQKVEVFEHAISETSGQDLAKVLWLKSANSETWLDRRTNFTRSLAAMSIVGYVLGLGDRHPSNLMCERASGRILHIDFGDCFEVAMHRSKFPETVPFRLTRMLVNAMEVSGIEGNYRITCQNVMRVLRENKESVATMLEAFVYDPLITWRLFQPKGRLSAAGQDNQGANPGQNQKSSKSQPNTDSNDSPQSRPVRFVGLGADIPPESNIGSVMEYGFASVQTTATRATNKEEDAAAKQAQDKYNQRALDVVRRVLAKLNGQDFDTQGDLDVNQQVERLIKEAQARENLAVMYTGWSPVW